MSHSDFTKERLNKTINELNRVSLGLAIRYLPSCESRDAFLKEINEVINSVRREISIHCLSAQGGIELLAKEIKFLEQQRLDIYTTRAMQYAAIEKKKREDRNYLILKQVGFVGGGTQVFSGFGICLASFGTACATLGGPLISHGLNNFYENGYYLLYRKNRQGFVRHGYRKIAQLIGYTGKESDYAYASIDLVLSGYGLSRQVLKEDRFRLFRHVNADFIRGWRTMGKISLGMEFIGDGFTAYGIYQLNKETD